MERNEWNYISFLFVWYIERKENLYRVKLLYCTKKSIIILSVNKNILLFLFLFICVKVFSSFFFPNWREKIFVLFSTHFSFLSHFLSYQTIQFYLSFYFSLPLFSFLSFFFYTKHRLRVICVQNNIYPIFFYNKFLYYLNYFL